jgi:hypothetical protein
MTAVSLNPDVAGEPSLPQGGMSGAAYTAYKRAAVDAGFTDYRNKRFIAESDRPTDITDPALVAAKLIRYDGYSPTARIMQFVWHTPQAGAGTTMPNTAGAWITVNAENALTATQRLTHVSTAPGTTVSVGRAPIIHVDSFNYFVERIIPEGQVISDIYFIGLPITQGTQPTNILPSWLEVSVIG